MLRDPRNPGRQGLFGGRDADPAADSRRGQRTPFLTHINAYDLDLYLRIAPELYLKRLCVGGVERVFELGRAFRNEGVGFSHNPIHAAGGLSGAHADYNVWIDGCRGLIQNAALAANGEQVFLRPGENGTLEPVDISGAWTVKTVHDAVSEALGEHINADTDLTTLRRLCDAAGIPYLTHWDEGAVVLELYEHLVEDRTESPPSTRTSRRRCRR